jgi:hypothetical protein
MVVATLVFTDFNKLWRIEFARLHLYPLVPRRAPVRADKQHY